MLESLQSLDLQGFLTKRSAFRDGIHNVVSQLDSSYYASQKRGDTNRNANQKSKEILYAPSCQCFERFRRLEARRKGNVLLAIVTSLIFIGGQKKSCLSRTDPNGSTQFLSTAPSPSPSTTLFQDRSTCHDYHK